MKISIFGTGYVGLVTGACLSELGHQVMCVDIDKNKIENLKKGTIPIYEPELDEIVKRNFEAERLFFTTDSKKAISFGKAIFNAVGTPPDKENNNKADLKYVEQVAKTIGENLDEYKLLINKSTVPVGTGKKCRNIIKREVYNRKKNIEFDVASNPEFLREGNAIYDFLNPDRIVCGIQNEKSKLIMEEIYKPLEHKTDIIFTDIKSAEIIKYASNAFLATKISFINEIANFAEKVGGNISDISRGIGADHRIGDKFLESGIGYGGSCFPKDIKAFIETGKDYDYDFKIIKETENVNERQKTIVVDKLLELLPSLEGKIISIWGLSFKPNTDDIRDAPSISVIKRLIDSGVEKIKTFDPISMEYMKKEFNGENKIYFSENSYEALNESDVLIILTQWNEFKIPNLKKIRKNMRGNIIIDGRNIWDEEALRELNFIYKGIGQGNG